MIKTPLSTVIGGAFWTPGATVIGGGALNFEKLIAKLFANNEQGFAYDPNDLSTLYQDSTGSTPVTGIGQTVGLILDKSKLAEQTVVKDVKFADGLGGISISSSQVEPTHTMKLVNGLLDIRLDTPTPVVSLSLANVGDIGDWVHVTVDCAEYTSGSLKVDGLSIPIVNKAGVNSGIFQLISTSLSIYRQSAPTLMKLRGIKVVKLKGNHAYQTVSASRPILQRNATTGAYYLAFDGVDDFLQTNNIDFTMTDKVSLFAGVRKLSDALTGIVCEFGAVVDTTNGTFSIMAPALAGAEKFRIAVRGSILRVAATTAIEYSAPVSAVVMSNVSLQTPLVELRVNSKSLQKSTVDLGGGSLSSNSLYIGRRGGVNLQFNGHLYSLIGIGRLTSDSETMAIEKALAKNTGVTLNV